MAKKEDIKEKYEYEEEKLLKLPIQIAFEIAEKAHRNQYRVNGDYYFTHPLRMFDYYQDLLLKNNCPYKMEAMKDNSIPRDGVEELILLHDAVEDTGVTHKEIRNIYYEHGWKEYFDKYIDEPLKLITHDKREKYETYINKVMSNPVSAFIKMIDIINNLDMLRLDKLGDYEYERVLKYVKYFKMINDKYHYVEKIRNYLEDVR